MDPLTPGRVAVWRGMADYGIPRHTHQSFRLGRIGGVCVSAAAIGGRITELSATEGPNRRWVGGCAWTRESGQNALSAAAGRARVTVAPAAGSSFVESSVRSAAGSWDMLSEDDATKLDELFAEHLSDIWTRTDFESRIERQAKGILTTHGKDWETLTHGLIVHRRLDEADIRALVPDLANRWREFQKAAPSTMGRTPAQLLQLVRSSRPMYRSSEGPVETGTGVFGPLGYQ